MFCMLVAIPVFNEARHLRRVIAEVRRYVRDILIIDDGSTDRTPAILSRMDDIAVITHPENRGYGQSLIDAFAYADRQGYEWVLTLDCDEQHEPGWIPTFRRETARKNAADIISGSRYLRHLPGDTHAPPERRRINAIITDTLNCLLGLQLTDAFCGFKAHRVSAMRRLQLTVPGYAFPLQFWVQAAAAGLRIREIPVPLIYNDPRRTFGGTLDDPEARLRHYFDVLVAALDEAGLGTESPCMDSITEHILLPP